MQIHRCQTLQLVAFTAITFSTICLVGVRAHGYLKIPRSRNFVAYQDKVWHGQTENDPKPEDCPHCLNRGGSISACGITGSQNYSDPRNAFGDEMPVNIQAVFSRGQEIDVDVVLTAHHKGHFTFKACPVSIGKVPNQECFDEFPLEFVKDNMYGAPKDPNYPERAYIPLSNYPALEYDSTGVYGSKYSYRFKLPLEAVGELVLLQWHYVTANSCKLPGYDNYTWPDGFYDDETQLSPCGELPKDGNGVPEQFWNCAEVRIVDGETPSTTLPPTQATTTRATLSPTTSNPVTGPPSTAPATSTAYTSPVTTETTTTLEPLTPNTNFCGKSWVDANSNCRLPNKIACPDGNSTACPVGEHCYADVSCIESGSSSTGAPWTTDAPWTTPRTVPAVTTTTSAGGEPIESHAPRCGKSDLDARENCGPTCSSDEDCSAGLSCYVVHANFCGSIDKPQWVNPSVSTQATRCGKTEVHARELCGSPCTSAMDCDVASGEDCFAVFQNYCGSDTENGSIRKLRGGRAK